MQKQKKEVVAIEPRRQDDDGFKAYLEKAKDRLADVAPKWLKVDRIIRLAAAARFQNPSLRECSKESFLVFLMKMAETGLETIGPGGAWAVPFRNKYTGQKEVQFIPDWRGLVAIAKRSGRIKAIDAHVVYEKDVIDISFGDEPRVIHKPALQDRGEIVGAYAIVTEEGAKHVEWLGIEDIEKIRKHSKARDSGPWVEWKESMVLKSVVRRAMSPFAGSSKELAAYIQLDDEFDFEAKPEPKQIEVKEVQETPEQNKHTEETKPANNIETGDAQLF